MSRVSIQALQKMNEIVEKQYATSSQIVSLNFLFLKVAGDINDEFDSLLGNFKLSSGRYTLLSLLQNNPQGLHPSSLAENLGVTQATITGLLNSLEKDEFIARKKNLADARSVVVTLTQFGQDTIASIIPKMIPIIERYLGHLDQTEQKKLFEMIFRIHEHSLSKS